MTKFMTKTCDQNFSFKFKKITIIFCRSEMTPLPLPPLRKFNKIQASLLMMIALDRTCTPFFRFSLIQTSLAIVSVYNSFSRQTNHLANFFTKAAPSTISAEVAIFAVRMHIAAIISTPLTILAILAQVETVDAAFCSVCLVARFPSIPSLLHH